MEVTARRWGALAALAGLLSVFAPVMRAAEPCKLLTVQEIGQVLGASFSAMPLGTTGCYWTGGPQRVSIVLRDATAWPRITAPGPGGAKTSVSGIGDAAQYSGKEDALTLSVKQGSHVIVLTVYGVKGLDRQRSSEESLARLALKRL